MINHEKEISIVEFLSENCLVTVGLDKVIKVWALENGCQNLIGSNGVKLVASAKVSKEIKTIRYCHKKKMLAFMDTECSLGVVHLDISNLAEDDDDFSIDVDMVDIDAMDLEDALVEDDKPGEQTEQVKVSQKSQLSAKTP